MKLSDFQHVVDFPKRNHVVYVLFFCDDEKSFYVGETESFIGRMTDYVRSSFDAATDKVGDAVRYLLQNNVRVRVGYEEHANRETAIKREAEIIDRLSREGIPLLNQLRGYEYRTAIEADERSKVHRFCCEHILNALNTD